MVQTKASIKRLLSSRKVKLVSGKYTRGSMFNFSSWTIKDMQNLLKTSKPLASNERFNATGFVVKK